MSLEETVATSKTTEGACVEREKKDVPKHVDLSSKRGRDNANPFQPKVYFERQTEHYCGLAALNNLYG